MQVVEAANVIVPFVGLSNTFCAELESLAVQLFTRAIKCDVSNTPRWLACGVPYNTTPSYSIAPATGTDVSNNVVVLDDLTISPLSQVACAVFIQGQYANAGGPNLDFNIYSVYASSDAQTVRFIEMNKTNNLPKNSDWMLYKDEFTKMK